MKNSPNILFVFSDQHRHCDFHRGTNPDLHTPNFDRFCSEALSFDHCFSESPLCVPARGTLLTGLLPQYHKAIGNDVPINTKVESVADVLGANGYQTGYIGKWHLAGVPRDQKVGRGRPRLGFEAWKVNQCSHSYLNTHYDDEENQRHAVTMYEPDHQTDLAESFIQSRADTSPWALWLSFGPPHDPYHDVPQPWLDLYSPEKIRLRKNVRVPAHRSREVSVNNAALRECLRGYYAHISALDHCFGRLLRCLEATGQAENTIVVYTSDHGDQLGSHGWMNKQLPYEESVRVPLAVRWPHAIKPRKCHELIGLADLAPTLLGLTNTAFTNPVDGKDFSSLFTSGTGHGREHLYLFDLTACHQSSQRGTPAWRAIRTRDKLLALTATGEPWLAFDLENDPLQQINLLRGDSIPPIFNLMRETLEREVRQHDAWQEPDDLIRSMGLADAWNKSQIAFGLPALHTT